MKMSNKGKEILIKLEGGHRLSAYKDERGIPTIGVGIIYYPPYFPEDGLVNIDKRANSPVKLEDEIFLDQSNWLLDYYLNDFENHLSAILNAAYPQNQFDALVSFCYNEGFEAFHKSLLYELILAADLEQVEREFFNWTRAGAPGTSSLGLRWRRHVEANLFMGRI